MTQTFERQDIGYLLTAYADGQLAPAGVMWVEEQLDRNPDLRARLKEIRHLQAGLRTAFAGGAPEFVLDLPRREALLASAANPSRKKLRFHAPLWIGLAASVMAIVYVGIQVGSPLRRSNAYAVHEEAEVSALLRADAFSPAEDANGQAPPTKIATVDGYDAKFYSESDHEGATGKKAKADDAERQLAKDQNRRADIAGWEHRGEYRSELKQTTTMDARRPSAVAAPATTPAAAPAVPPAIINKISPADQLAQADRGGRAVYGYDKEEYDDRRSAANSPAKSRAQEPEKPQKPQEYARARAMDKLDDGRLNKGEKPGATAGPKSESTVVGADSPSSRMKEIEQLPAQLAEANVAGPIRGIDVPLEEKTKGEGEKFAESAKGNENAVVTSETVATGAFMAIGAVDKKNAEGRVVAKPKLEGKKASSPGERFKEILAGEDIQGQKENEKAELQRQLEVQAAQLAIVKKRYPKVAENEIAVAMEALTSGDAELDGLRQRAAEQHAKLEMLKERFPKIAAEISDEKASASFLQGVVGAVRNSPQGEPELLMLTLGKGDQVADGTEFIIFRGNDYIVRVRAEKTLGDMIACRIIPDSWNSRGLHIQQGDLAQNRLGGDDVCPDIAVRSLLVTSSAVDPLQSLAALRAPVTLDGTLGLAQSLRLIGGEKIGYTLTSGAQGLLERQVLVSLRDEPAARGVLRAVRSAGLQAQFTGGLVKLDAATRPLDPADTQGFDLPTFKDLFGTSPMQITAVDAIQTVAIDADTASYDYAKARVAAGQPVDPATIKPEHFINAMPMDYPAAQGPEAFTLYAEAAPSPFARANTAWGARTALVSIGAVAKPAAADERKPLALTLAIDCSGSMAQAGGLDRIQRGLLAFVDHLRAEDRVSIVAFGDQARVILPATPGNDRAALTNALANLATGGATNAAEGLGLAYQLAAETAAVGVESRVLLATDGGTVAGADDLLRRVTAFKDRGITLVVVGTGQTYRAGPLQDLATKGDGQHFYVGSDEDAETLFTGKLLPDRLAVLAKDAKLQVTWNPQRVSHARLIGYDQRRLAAKDFRDNSVDAGELSQDTQVTALFEVLLVDGGAGPLGTAAVRYQDMRREQVRELACPLPGTILQSQASDRLRLLACAAATAEWLQRGWWSNVHLITPEEIRAQLARCPQPIANELRAMVK